MSHIHIEKWAARAAIDYYMQFIKAWIPFNAWYKRECKLARLPVLTDANCIEHVCNTTNTFKTRIITLLGGEDRDSEKFRDLITDLHHELQAHVIPEPESPLNFSTMIPGITSTNLVQKDFRAYHYKVERIPHGTNFQFDIRVEDKATHSPRYTKTLNRWNLNDIEADQNFLALQSEECKKKIIEFFKEVNPKKPLDIVLKPKIKADGTIVRPSHSIEIGNQVYFVDDKEKIAKVLIHLLYKLRCEIFHGSLDPTEANMGIYKNAYHIQYELVKELI